MSVIFIAFFSGGFDWYSPQEFLSGTVVFRKQLRMPTCNVLCCPGMHGRGSQASAPASDAAGCRSRGRDAADRTSVPRRATWRVPNRADTAKIGADAAQIGPTRSVSAVSADICRIGRYLPVSADIGRNRPNRPVSAETARFGPKFKKKKVQNAPFDLT